MWQGALIRSLRAIAGTVERRGVRHTESPEPDNSVEPAGKSESLLDIEDGVIPCHIDPPGHGRASL